MLISKLLRIEKSGPDVEQLIRRMVQIVIAPYIAVLAGRPLLAVT